MKIYVTKYALVVGVYEAEAEIIENYAVVRIGRDGKELVWADYFKKNEYAFTEKDAIEQANLRRGQRISSLRKQIEKLEIMVFPISKPK
jgi:hypothetical protein